MKTWLLPSKLVLESEVFHWEESIGKKQTAVSPARGMLEEFMGLEKADDERIFRYARRWGLLKVQQARIGRTDTWTSAGSDLREVAGGEVLISGVEPLSVWRHWIARFAAAIRSGARIRFSKPPERCDWEVLHQLEADEDDIFLIRCLLQSDPVHFKKEEARFWLYSQIQRWAKFGEVSLTLDWDANAILITTRSLFAGLVVQLMAAMCSSNGLAVCSECGKTYSPTRKPVPGKRSYCRTCHKKGVPGRNATRAHRERQKQGEQE